LNKDAEKDEQEENLEEEIQEEIKEKIDTRFMKKLDLDEEQLKSFNNLME